MVPDYYAMLGIDRGADQATITAALAKCQPAWSSGTRNPKNRHTFQSYLDQIPALRKALLGDFATRAAYDSELAAARRVERDRKLDELDRLVRLRAAKGGLTVSDRTLLRGEASRLGLAGDDLDRLIEPYPPRPESPIDRDEADEPPVDAIDPSMRGQIRVALGHIGRKDLYDVLDLPRDAPAAEILARSDAERQRWMNKSQVTAEKTAWLEAVSYAQSHLVRPETRARYDRTLAVEAEDGLIASIGFALKGSTAMETGTKQALLDEAASLGIAPDRGSRLIRETCKSLGVSFDAPASSIASGPIVSPPRQLRCRSCSGLTEFSKAAKDAASAHCRHCGESLRWSCPVCQRDHWIDTARCACKFSRELREPLIRYFEAAQLAHRERRYADALDLLGKVRELAPKHVGARKGIEKVKERIALIEQVKSQFEVEKSRRHLVAAHGALNAWSRLVDPAEADLKAEATAVVRGLRDAHEVVVQARALLGSDPRASRALFRKALGIAADLPEARDGLRQCPPDPPTGLELAVEPGGLRLRWSGPPPDGLGAIAFRIVRKRGAQPIHEGDGEIVGDSESTEWVDRSALPGGSFGYAVLSVRNEIRSIRGASAGPILILAEVNEIRVEVRSRTVDLEWSTPTGAVDVIVLRKTGGPPSGPRDGLVVPASLGRAHDVGLIDDQTYHYGLFALYPGPGGSPIASKGAFTTASPHAPAVAVEDLRPQLEADGRVRLTWTPPDRGEVRILRSSQVPQVNSGQKMTRAEAEALGGDWLSPIAPGEAIDSRPPIQSAFYYTPMTSRNGTLTVGPAAAFSCLADPTDLRCVRADNEGRVHLRWKWSPRSVQCLVVARSGSEPSGPDDPSAVSATVQDVDYSRLGFFSMILPRNAPAPWHVRVYSIAYLDGSRVVSAGNDPTSRSAVPGPDPEITVRYRLRPPIWPGKGWMISIQTDPPGSAVPPIALVSHARTVPLTVDDGRVVARFPASTDGASFRFSPPVSPSEARVRAFVDPAADPSTLPPIRFRHPESGGTRV